MKFGLGKIARSSLSEAREKISWEAFEYLLCELSARAEKKLWKGHRVFAVDGTCLNLPHTNDIIKSFPLDSDLRYRAHYPKGLLLTVLDVLSGIPITAEVEHYRTISERELLRRRLAFLPQHSILLLDRGFDGVRMFKAIADEGFFFVARVRTREHDRCSIPVREFIKSGKKEAVVDFTNVKGISMKLRLLRYENDCQRLPIVLATNLLGATYSRAAIKKCYRKRWKVETLYLRLKRLISVENFHARSVNGVKQEIFSSLFVLGMTAWLVGRAVRKQKINPEQCEPNFKNALYLISQWLELIVWARSKRPKPFNFDEIAKVICVKQHGRKNPRIARRPQTSWRRPDGKNRARVQDEKKRSA